MKIIFESSQECDLINIGVSGLQLTPLRSRGHLIDFNLDLLSSNTAMSCFLLFYGDRVIVGSSGWPPILTVIILRQTLK